MQQSGEQLDQVFFALSDPTRRAIVSRLAEGSTTVGELAKPFDISAPAISRHMRVLESAGLLRREVKGREHLCTLSTMALKTAEDWLNFHRDFWESRFDALEEMFRQVDPN
ncbi:MAG: metalloregulator ArsR/SmtB family transcription factor [Gammaproteobacteria bacterium]|nr:metalloregulator ArsR/SmtB family transcription factor [Gammaproteobacteria bacterium]